MHNYRTDAKKPDRFSFPIDNGEQEEKNNRDGGDDQMGGDMIGHECFEGEQVRRVVDTQKSIRDEAEGKTDE